eukprot:gnl/TRDRNA2_/TRDRNA2_208276_c0_seq1.p1 gnl/TRDRNA2_/TRDRNA2_208276_c0~~gnl/TRDRNA2_/TRDRNA2_208276_c0_seq1.p1  ORF type:complete len:275 (-),score=42.04 gnl/TRDRNA2_/TRDRNA2_208276_c0_seq1:33-857(-)
MQTKGNLRVITLAVVLTLTAQAFKRRKPNGEDVCEAEDLDKAECEARNLCCVWSEDDCWSAIGRKPCLFYDVKVPSYYEVLRDNAKNFSAFLKQQLLGLNDRFMDLSVMNKLAVILALEKVLHPLFESMLTIAMRWEPLRRSVDASADLLGEWINRLQTAFAQAWTAVKSHERTVRLQKMCGPFAERLWVFMKKAWNSSFGSSGAYRRQWQNFHLNIQPSSASMPRIHVTFWQNNDDRAGHVDIVSVSMAALMGVLAGICMAMLSIRVQHRGRR